MNEYLILCVNPVRVLSNPLLTLLFGSVSLFLPRFLAEVSCLNVTMKSAQNDGVSLLSPDPSCRSYPVLRVLVDDLKSCHFRIKRYL